ncbi:MAG: T9SS type A sorting domain-containing protein [Candidatus Electryonea clarkiae]|nr:T9SS type A sorting domain-containing protein [Candidatus Electryonea clarkiae]MDP8285365.1 T9SS type A sorting domain-containing protein [Candidatus Electryonea clarkiae]
MLKPQYIVCILVKCLSILFYFPEADASVFGIITDSMTEAGIEGAVVTFGNYEATTDDDGVYSVDEVLSGVYDFEIEAEDYVTFLEVDVEVEEGDNELDFELAPIFERSIRQLQQEQDLETWVLTTGIVTQGTNVTDTVHTNIYIQDDSGWGIQIWDDDPWEEETEIMRGDEVDVFGFLVEENNITRITNFEIEVTGNDFPSPDPLIENTGDMSQNDQREGTWARISGQINRDPPDQGTYSTIVNDGSGQCEVQISGSANLDMTEFSAGDWGTFYGVISLHRTGLRIIPNVNGDIERIDVDPPTNLVAETEVIDGDILELSVTLSWDHDHLDEWLRFKIYRDGVHIGNTQQNSWNEWIEDPNPGEEGTYTYEYEVTAVYDEGETESAEVEVIWDTGRIEINIPTDLSADTVEINGDTLQLEVTLSWEHDHLDDWIRFKIYRDGEHIGNTLQDTWSETLTDPNPEEFGIYTYRYTVTALYDEGESEESNAVQVVWDTERIEINTPTNLSAETDEFDVGTLYLGVALSWQHEHLDDFTEFNIYRDEVHVGTSDELTWLEVIIDPNPGEIGTYTYIYSVTAVYDEGESEESNAVEVVWDITSIRDYQFSGVPANWALEAVYPNPFNPTVSIVIAVPEVAVINVEIVNVLGQHVAMLHRGSTVPGFHRLNWNAVNQPAGLYLLKVSSSSGFSEIRKLMYLK